MYTLLKLICTIIDHTHDNTISCIAIYGNVTEGCVERHAIYSWKKANSINNVTTGQNIDSMRITGNGVFVSFVAAASIIVSWKPLTLEWNS